MIMEKINYVSAAEAVKLIKSGDSVYIQGSTSIPEVLVRAMTDRAGELRPRTSRQAPCAA